MTMKTLLLFCLSLSLLTAPLGADLTTYDKAVHLGNEVHIKPALLTSGTTSIVSQDVFLTTLVLIVPTSGATTITVQDKQGTPIPLFPGITVTSGTTYFLAPNIRYWCSGGFSVTANGNVYLYASWEQRGAPGVTQ